MSKIRSVTTPKQSGLNYQQIFSLLSPVLFLSAILVNFNASIVSGSTIITNFGLVAMSLGLSIAGLTSGIAASVIYLSKH